MAQTQYAAGHFERALANVRRSLELDPTAAGAHVLLRSFLDRCPPARRSARVFRPQRANCRQSARSARR